MTAHTESRDAQETAALPLREDAERRGEVSLYEAPDLPGQWVARDAVTGVVSQGNSRPHGLAMLAEALALHAGEALPVGEAAAPSAEAPLGPEAIPALGCDWQKIEGILSHATPLVVFEILTRLAQHLITRLYRPCPHDPPHLVGVVPPQLQGDAQAWLRLADPHVVKIQAMLDRGRALLAQGRDLVAESDTLLAGGQALLGLPGEPS